MKALKRIIYLAVIMSVSSVSVARKMTLRDCVEYARDNAYTNRLRSIDVEKSDVEVRRAVSEFLPYLGLSASGNISFGRNIDPETNTYDNKQTLSSGLGIQLSVPLFDGLVNVNRLKSAQMARQRMIKSAAVEQDRITAEVIGAFYEVSYCRAMVTQMEEQLVRDKADLRATERQVSLGTKSGADVAEIAALVANDEYELLNRENLLRKSYLSLRSAMGMELGEEPLDLEDNDMMLTVVRDAVNDNPKIAEARLMCRETDYALRAAKGGYFPRVSLTGGISTSFYRMLGKGNPSPDFGSQWRNNMGEYLGVTVSVPLFDGLSASNAVKHARLERKESELRLEQVGYELERETIEAELDYSSSCEEYIAARRRVEAEEEAYRGVRRKYELGMASAIDLYSSSAKLQAARANCEGKRIQRIISLLTLNYCKTGCYVL